MQVKSGKKDAAGITVEFKAVLDRCALIERKCSELYRCFARMHAEFPDLQALWFRTAEEEEHHAVQFQMLSRVKGSAVLGLTVQIEDTTPVLEALDKLLVKAQTGFLAPEAALKLALKLESQINRFHANSVVLCGDPELKRLLDAMMGNDKEHVQTLESTLRELQQRHDGFTDVLRKVEKLAEEIRDAKLAPIQVLKAAIKFETMLSRQYHVWLAEQNDPELQQVMRTIIEKNKVQVQLIGQAQDRLEAQRSGKLARDLKLARSERVDRPLEE